MIRINDPPKTCEFCKSRFERGRTLRHNWLKKRFCNNRCSRKFIAKQKRIILEKNCICCEKIYRKNPKYSPAQWEKSNYCSYACTWKAKYTGYTPLRELDRRRTVYKTWRKAVFERDDYTCQFCGKRGGWLEADHIKPWFAFPALRLVLDNGRTLCRPCHITTFKDLTQWTEEMS